MAIPSDFFQPVGHQQLFVELRKQSGCFARHIFALGNFSRNKRRFFGSYSLSSSSCTASTTVKRKKFTPRENPSAFGVELCGGMLISILNVRTSLLFFLLTSLITSNVHVLCWLILSWDFQFLIKSTWFSSQIDTKKLTISENTNDKEIQSDIFAKRCLKYM